MWCESRIQGPGRARPQEESGQPGLWGSGGVPVWLLFLPVNPEVRFSTPGKVVSRTGQCFQWQHESETINTSKHGCNSVIVPKRVGKVPIKTQSQMRHGSKQMVGRKPELILEAKYKQLQGLSSVFHSQRSAYTVGNRCSWVVTGSKAKAEGHLHGVGFVGKFINGLVKPSFPSFLILSLETYILSDMDNTTNCMYYCKKGLKLLSN